MLPKFKFVLNYQKYLYYDTKCDFPTFDRHSVMHLKVKVRIFICILNLYLNLSIIYIMILIFYNVAANIPWGRKCGFR